MSSFFFYRGWTLFRFFFPTSLAEEVRRDDLVFYDVWIERLTFSKNEAMNDDSDGVFFYSSLLHFRPVSSVFPFTRLIFSQVLRAYPSRG
jgi:hypothetical protein